MGGGVAEGATPYWAAVGCGEGCVEAPSTSRLSAFWRRKGLRVCGGARWLPRLHEPTGGADVSGISAHVWKRLMLLSEP